MEAFFIALRFPKDWDSPILNFFRLQFCRVKIEKQGKFN